MKECVKGFQGQHRFLSNFYPVEVIFDGLTFRSSEAAYQAAKAQDEQLRIQFVCLNARAARKLGQAIKARPGWQKNKLNVMYRVLRAKFAKEPTRSMLLNTEDAYLEETNYWHDSFWGVYNGKGTNHLGRLLMVVRDELVEGII